MSPDVGVMLLTYNRLEYAKRTLITALEHLQPRERVRLHIASDGDDDEYVNTLARIAGAYLPVELITGTNSQRGGYGKNFNMATQVLHPVVKYVLPLEDDWELRADLDLDVLTKVIDDTQIGCLRLGYIGFTQELRGSYVSANGTGLMVLKFDPASPEPHVFAGHPRLETVAWEQAVGPWPEGLLPGETEFAVTHKTAARRGVAWPLWLPPSGGLFAHIGTLRSW